MFIGEVEKQCIDVVYPTSIFANQVKNIDMRLAIIDMYNGEENQGMRCIKEIIQEHPEPFDWQVFEVRNKHQVPNSNDFDIYIFTGGPGNPLEGEPIWETPFYQLIEDLWQHNLKAIKSEKKHVFFICHSFQMACHHFKIGKVTQRKSVSFGTFPVFKTEDGLKDDFFKPLPNPFYVADFRSYQLVELNEKQAKKIGAKVLMREKKRPHVPLERAIMGVRFSDEILGVQFHPEADPEGMTIHFGDEKRKEIIIEDHSEEKYDFMIQHLNDPDKIPLTHQVILPSFLDNALKSRRRSNDYQAIPHPSSSNS
ncbi:MAG: GMP synthase [Chitinophagales bacterium]